LIALTHPDGVSGAFVAFALVAAVVLVGIAWYSVRKG
jgi:hypothetical protein